MKKQYVKILWNDAVSVDAWTSAEEIIPESAVIETVGMLVTENDDIVVVALSHDTNNDKYSSYINIPKKWIIKRKIMRG